MHEGFRSAQKPHAEVVTLLERALYAARQGHIRSVALVAVNPMHEVETATAGDLSEIRAGSLVRGLARVTNELI